MNRKLVKHGDVTLMVSLPAKWIKSKKLKQGDEIELLEEDGSLKINSTSKNTQKKVIQLNIPNVSQRSTRIHIINAYRAGFDTINVHFDGNEKTIQEITEKYLIGFEVFKKGDSDYILDTISESTNENFENIIQRQLHIISELLTDLSSPDVPNYAQKVIRYNNFLNRALSKGIFSTLSTSPLHHFLNRTYFISRECHYFYKDIKKEKLKLTKTNLELIQNLQQMFELLKKSYLKKDVKLISKIHEIEEKIIIEKGKKSLQKSPLSTHHILQIGRTIYLAASPLIALFENK
ncbi:hypothetical protein HN587_01160 [Candidatus Woesearchaeota archaeon]|jgi:hypothetical protein|nr:hypothetical protein [Candidatus Woesearchaeota archaeon]